MLQVPRSHFPESLSFDDVLVMPGYSEVLPHQVNLKTRFSASIDMHSPLVSAAMDTVTESATAIALAQCGGMGVIHKNLSIEDQASEVEKVKRSESGMIAHPVVIAPDVTIRQVKEIMLLHNISGLPVIDNKKLVGIVTGRDIAFASELDQPVTEVMTKKVVTAPVGTSYQEAVKILYRHRIEKLPVVTKDDKGLVGMFTIKDIEKAQKYPHSSRDSQGRLRVAGAVGVGDSEMKRVEALLAAGCDAIVVDTAHGHSKTVMDQCRRIRKDFKKMAFDLVGGNIATSDGALSLVEAGVDAVKVGMGPGSICTTRIVTGIGVAQLTAIMDAAKVCQAKGVPVIADGGIKFSGDALKALAGGASTVMVGSLFAGTEEAPGEMVLYKGKSYKTYRGMGSLGAMAKGSRDRYFQGNVSSIHKFVPEGIEGRVAYKGPIENSIYQIMGGIRSGIGYVGAKDIDDLQKKAKFMRISPGGLKESHPHGVYITREAPNYYSESPST
ncbi:MAG: IMP dehydrogenase [Proteobacteria bacterium]|nr:IMP dehydrogenase [Pseudomonadota bacterium]